MKGIWGRRFAAFRELWRERGVIVLSPKVLGLWWQREALVSEVAELRARHQAAHEKLAEMYRRIE